MGHPRGGRYDGAVRRYLTPRCLGMHVTLLVVLPLFTWLTWWQLNRAQSGNTLSWAYVILWPAFAVYAIYTWWQLVHDQAARLPGRRGATQLTAAHDGPSVTPDVSAGTPAARPPGWALTGGRSRNMAIAASAPIDAERGGRGERFTAQTPVEAERLAAYNRYLESLSAEAERATGDGR